MPLGAMSTLSATPFGGVSGGVAVGVE